MDKILTTYKAMRKAADDYAAGRIGGDALHSAIVDYTDSIIGFTVSFGIDGQIFRIQRNER